MCASIGWQDDLRKGGDDKLLRGNRRGQLLWTDEPRHPYAVLQER
jgi:hypothetical protein